MKSSAAIIENQNPALAYSKQKKNKKKNPRIKERQGEIRIKIFLDKILVTSV